MGPFDIYLIRHIDELCAGASPEQLDAYERYFTRRSMEEAQQMMGVWLRWLSGARTMRPLVG